MHAAIILLLDAIQLMRLAVVPLIVTLYLHQDFIAEGLEGLEGRVEIRRAQL
jgi:hypothetical protein